MVGCVLGCSGAQAQSPGSDGGAAGLRGTGGDVLAAATTDSTADQFRSSPSVITAPIRGNAVDPAAATPAEGGEPAPVAPGDPTPAIDAPESRSATTPLAATDDRPPAPPGVARAVKPVKQYGPRRPAARHPLPALKPYETAIRPRGQATPGAAGLIAPLRGSVSADPQLDPRLGDPAVVNPPAVPPPTVAAIPAPERRRKPPVDATPYAPIGIAASSLRLFPYVETDLGYDSNPDQTTRSAAKGSAFTRIEGGTTLQSDWSRHSLSADLRAGYYEYFSNHNADRPDASGTVNGRLDVTRDFTLDSTARFAVGTQRPGSPEIVLGQAGTSVTGRPLVYSYGGDIGVTQRFNRLALTLRGSIDHFGYEDAKSSDGTTVALSRDNYTAYAIKPRLSYELTPGFTPFVEGLGSVRRYDNHTDSAGTYRNSTGEGVKVGSTFEVTRLLTGEVAVGYENRDYVDKTLRPLRAPLVDASLVYKPTALTAVSLKASSELNETNIPLSSGAVSRRVSLEISHALFRNLTLTGLLSYQNIDYQGIKLNEDLYDVGLKAEYNLSRSVVVRGSFTHERLNSGSPGLDYTQNVFLLGLRLQR